ncbi:MAG: gfo/Idh/MocA family oxidoreductase [Paenibacillus sp.]|jgi:predicted dehydrogenase|nr:gfo/Idh/MocA family oxidoreductase [Paenibacillus sp.]
MKTWKVGLIGTGYYSDNHLQAWQRLPNVKITALCNRSREKLEAKALQYGVPADCLYQSYEEMIDHADIDFVDIVTGPETHLSIVRKAAAAGKHIICQKPLAPSVEEAEQIVRTAEGAGIRLMVTENWRWLQPYQSIRSLLDEGIVGAVQAVRYHHKAYYTPRMSPEAALPQPFFRTMPNLLFYEMGSHWFDVMRFLLGTPNRIYAEMNRISPHVIGEDCGVVLFVYDGYYCILDMSWATAEELSEPLKPEISAGFVEQMTIDGTLGTLKLYSTGKVREGRVTFTDTTGNERIVVDKTLFDPEQSHIRLQGHFLQCLESGDPFQTSGEQNLKTLGLVFAAYESAAQHKPVFFG